MERRQILKQMTEVNKLAINNAFDAMELFHDQSEQLASAMLNRSGWLSDESRKAAEAWIKAYKHGRRSLRQHIDDSYSRLETLFPSPNKEPVSKP